MQQMNPTANPSSLSLQLTSDLIRHIRAVGGWCRFDDFMNRALYSPGLGYYAHDSRKFGLQPDSGSDFVTAPELSPLFGRTLAHQIAQVLQLTGTAEVMEFGAGSGALAREVLQELAQLGVILKRYAIVDLSASLRARQQHTLAAAPFPVEWLDSLPSTFNGVMLGNEVLDAMPVQLLTRKNGLWFERGVSLGDDERLIFSDRPSDLRPPLQEQDLAALPPDYLTEIHPQAQAFMHTVAQTLQKGAAFFIDYGFPESEYYLPARVQGTLMCHHRHQAHANPLLNPGEDDITAHVNFSAMAMAAQDAGMDVLGYTSQAHFLINCGIADLLAQTPADSPAYLPLVAHTQKLLTEHEMGELFKVLAVGRGLGEQAQALMGFSRADRTHTL
jgi:SAM-dependent MidA family methyltransferase